MILIQQEKDLLLRDLSARLDYDIKVYNASLSEIQKLYGIIQDKCIMYEAYVNSELQKEYRKYGGYIPAIHHTCSIEYIKPYLRPLSSLTQKERDKFCDIGGVINYRPTDGKQYIVAFVPEALDYLNSIHVDYRGLIEKGLAIEVTNDNNPYK